jgi:hypothetical protein
MGHVKIHKSTVIIAILILLGILVREAYPQSTSFLDALHPLMPDPKLTPCSVNPTQSFCIQPPTICNQTILCAVDSEGHKIFHTSDTRKVSETTKHAVCKAYGITTPCPDKQYEIDHLISLELCGSDDPRNLWPQPYTSPGAHEKDVLEGYLNGQVCGGKMTLEAAQRAIATNWWSAYVTMIGPMQVIGQ